MYCKTAHSFDSEHPQNLPLLVLVHAILRDAQELFYVVLVQLRVRQAHLTPYRFPVAVFLYVQFEVVCRARRPEAIKLRLWALLGKPVVLLNSLHLLHLVVLARRAVKENVSANCAQRFRRLYVLLSKIRTIPFRAVRDLHLRLSLLRQGAQQRRPLHIEWDFTK